MNTACGTCPKGLIRRATCTCRARSSRAREAFVGTYGGFSYMAPFYGVKSLAFYSDPDGFSQKHLHMARSAFDASAPPGLLDVRDALRRGLDRGSRRGRLTA